MGVFEDVVVKAKAVAEVAGKKTGISCSSPSSPLS